MERSSKGYFLLEKNDPEIPVRAKSWRFNFAWMFDIGGGDAKTPRPLDITKNWNETPNATCHYKIFCWNNDIKSQEYYWTNVMAVIGPETAFNMFENEGVDIEKCKNMICFIEVNHSNNHWCKPGDFTVDMLSQKTLCGTDGKGVLVGFVDREVWYIKSSIPLELFRCFLTTEALKHNREVELKQ